MSKFNLKNTSSRSIDFKPAPSGAHIGRLIKLIDLGTQDSTYNGETKSKRQIELVFELPEELMENGTPYIVSRRVNLLFSEKATLRLMIESWTGGKLSNKDVEEFKLESLVSKLGMLNITHNESKGKIYANIQTVMPIPKKTSVPKQVNQSIIFSLDEFDSEIYSTLSNYHKELIKNSPEFKLIDDEDEEIKEPVITNKKAKTDVNAENKEAVLEKWRKQAI
jgi:hypothetical protein